MSDDNETGMTAIVIWTAVGMIAAIVALVVAAIVSGYLPIPFV